MGDSGLLFVKQRLIPTGGMTAVLGWGGHLARHDKKARNLTWGEIQRN
jgi:hypothetical protein